MEVFLCIFGVGLALCAFVLVSALVIALLISTVDLICNRSWRYAHFADKSLDVAFKVCGFLLRIFLRAGLSSGSGNSGKSSGSSRSSSSGFGGGSSRGGGACRNF